MLENKTTSFKQILCTSLPNCANKRNSLNLMFLGPCYLVTQHGLHSGTFGLCDISVVWHFGCDTFLLCDIKVVWHFGCDKFLLCDIKVVWHFGCDTFLLCDIKVVWHFCCVTFRLWYISVVWQWVVAPLSRDDYLTDDRGFQDEGTEGDRGEK